MKQKTFLIIDEQRKRNCIDFIDGMQPGKTKVTISDAGTKSQRQQGLNWQWNHEVAASGKGRFDSAIDVHREGKEMFAIPILMRDDPDYFPMIYRRYREISTGTQKEYNKFLDERVRTQEFTVAQVSEYLRSFEHYWLLEGVNLTNPDLLGLRF